MTEGAVLERTIFWLAGFLQLRWVGVVDMCDEQSIACALRTRPLLHFGANGPGAECEANVTSGDHSNGLNGTQSLNVAHQPPTTCAIPNQESDAGEAPLILFGNAGRMWESF